MSLVVPSAVAQGRMRVFFRAGHSLAGVVKAQTDDVIVLKTDDGTTYQYPMSDVRAVVADTLHRMRLPDKGVLKAYLLHETEDKWVFIEPSGSVVQCDKESVRPRGHVVESGKGGQPVLLHISLQASLSNQPLPPVLGGGIEGKVAIGYRDVVHRRFFVGGGVGYDCRFNASSQQQLLPLFARMEYYLLPERSWSPYVGVDAGYAFKLKGLLRGGLLCELSVGVQRQVGVKHQTFFLALFFKAQQCGAQVSESISSEVFYRNGYTSLLNGGLRLGFTL